MRVGKQLSDLACQLLSSQQRYVSGECSTEYYRQVMAEITQSFASLSSEVMVVVARFQEMGSVEVVRILQRLQAREKEKLEQVHEVASLQAAAADGSS